MWTSAGSILANAIRRSHTLLLLSNHSFGDRAAPATQSSERQLYRIGKQRAFFLRALCGTSTPPSTGSRTPRYRAPATTTRHTPCSWRVERNRPQLAASIRLQGAISLRDTRVPGSPPVSHQRPTTFDSRQRCCEEALRRFANALSSAGSSLPERSRVHRVKQTTKCWKYTRSHLWRVHLTPRLKCTAATHFVQRLVYQVTLQTKHL
ncbi:hypothetical protein HPB51_017927 [Rhipicephalus microplus]|uniref:Uncharacterized protein n=1 Tax=Rhipicephalus microplus TaxID=6941 RepID=A0A9J6EPS5_RHIMP|nr:hypothetical protein HPB51_017927 [Rhipicephalus microplus]